MFQPTPLKVQPTTSAFVFIFHMNVCLAYIYMIASAPLDLTMV